MKLVKRSGGFKRSQKYDLSSRHSNYLYNEYTDTISRSKSHLPVILSMEERRYCVNEDSYEDLRPYDITDSKSEEKLVHKTEGTQLQPSSFRIDSQYRNRSMGSRGQFENEHLYENPSRYNIAHSKGGKNLAYNADGTEFQMSTFKPGKGSVASEEVMKLDQIKVELL